MRIRRPKRRRWQEVPVLAFLLLSAPVVLIFWISTRISRHHPPPDKVSTDDMMMMLVNHNHNHPLGLVPLVETPRITYDLVVVAVVEQKADDQSKSNKNMIRYRALEERPEDGSLQPLTIQKWAQLMSHNDTTYAQQMALNLTHILQESPFDGFFFETKGCSTGNANEKQFEFVLINAEMLADTAKVADPQPFLEHLDNDCDNDDDNTDGCVFSNLDGSSMLIAPKNILDDDTSKGDTVYGHLATFVRGAPTPQIVELWRLTALSFLKRLEVKSPNTVWLSTSGVGVAWLHFRLDSQPKYYQYKEFADET